MSRTKWIVLTVAVIIAAVIVWRIVTGSDVHGGPGQGADAPVPVTVVPATSENVPVYLTNSGTVTPINTVNVQPQVGGELMSLDFVQGQPVKKGQLIARIDPRTLEAQLDQAIAKRNSDQTQLATAEANLERSKNPKVAPYLAGIDIITQENTVAQWKATVAADNASIKDTQVQLGFTKITSPINGIAGIWQVTPGNVITPSTVIVTITQMHPIDVLFTLAGEYLDEVRAAQARSPLHVAVMNADGSVVEGDGELKIINNQIDPSTATFQLKAEFPNPKDALYPGQYVPVRLQVRTDDNALVVPSAAVQRGPNGNYVWLVTDKPPAGSTSPDAGKAPDKRNGKRPPKGSAGHKDAPSKYVVMQPVTTAGESGDSGVIVSKGLKAGDLVVTAGQFRLKQGGRVTPMKPGEVPPPPTTAQIKAAAQQGGRRRH